MNQRFAGLRRIYRVRLIQFLPLCFLLACGVFLTTFCCLTGCSAADQSDENSIRAAAADFLQAQTLQDAQDTMTESAGKNLALIWPQMHKSSKAHSWSTNELGKISLEDEYFARISIQSTNSSKTDSNYFRLLLRKIGDEWLIYGIEVINSPTETTSINFENQFQVLSYAFVAWLEQSVEDVASHQQKPSQ